MIVEEVFVRVTLKNEFMLGTVMEPPEPVSWMFPAESPIEI